MCAWCFCSPVQHRPRPVPCSLTARDDQDGGAFPSPALQLHVLEVALEERQIMMRQSASTALISLAYLTTHITGRRGGLPVWSSPPCPASGIAPTCHSLPLTLYLSSDTADGRRPSLEWLLLAIPANHKSQLTMQGVRSPSTALGPVMLRSTRRCLNESSRTSLISRPPSTESLKGTKYGRRLFWSVTSTCFSQVFLYFYLYLPLPPSLSLSLSLSLSTFEGESLFVSFLTLMNTSISLQNITHLIPPHL